MKKRLSAIASLLLAAACGAADAGAPEPAARSPHSVVATATGFQFAGLVPLDALSSLPKGAHRPTPGYPGHGFTIGVVRDAAAWQSFAAASRLRDVPAIDFSRQMVVFAVLDAQTNALSKPTWELQAAGRAVFRFGWSGIEPFYVDQTPATLAVVDLAGVKSIAFSTTDGQDLGTVTL